VAVIDLDPSPVAPLAPPRPPLRVFRPAAVVAAVVLLLALGGAAPAAPVLWRPLGSVALSAQSTFAVAGNHFVATADTDSDGMPDRVTAWQGDPLEQLWSVPIPPASTGGVAAGYVGGRVSIAGNRVLVWRADYRTDVLDLRTGRTVFTATPRLDSVVGDIGLSADTVFRPGTEYDQQSGAAGLLYLSSTGRPYREPPLRSDLTAVALDTGRELWRLRLPGNVFTGRSGDALAVVSADRIQLVDLATGRIRKQGPAGRGGVWVDVLGDVAVVQGAERTVAYDLATLTARWSTPSGPIADTVTGATCDRVICRRTAAGVAVLDPATGVVRWQTGKDVSVFQPPGRYALEYDATLLRPLRVVDAATGQVTADLRGWPTAGFSSTGDVLLSRIEGGGRTMSFAALRAGRIQPLGYARHVVRECRAVDGLAVCRDEQGLAVFAYRTG
jgi:outer membrane protein assembly factor BamB